jgi:cell division transport system permease protein
MKNYLLRHVQVFFFSLGQLARTPLATLMTLAVIGITLALPAGLYVLFDNLQRASHGWDAGVQISLFLKQDTSERAADALLNKIRNMPGVVAVQYISRAQALTEFKRLSGFGDALDVLDSNPLPPVLVVRPSASMSAPDRVQTLVQALSRQPGVDLAQLDLEWIKRLHAMLALAQRGVLILAGLLALAVLLIIGNTIRLAILNRRSEIEVIKLIGGTDAFIRRPFLYSGLLQGLLGALAAWLLVGTSLMLLAGPAQDLAGLYGSRFELDGLGLENGLWLLLGGAGLGWLGSRLAVGRHLHAIEPT